MRIEYTRPTTAYSNPMYTPIVSTTGAATVHFLSGRCAQDAEGKTVCPGDMVGQFRYIMQALTDELQSIRADWSAVVFRRIYTTDMEACLLAEADEEVLSYLDTQAMPASTLVEVTRLAQPGYLLEIELTAVADPSA